MDIPDVRTPEGLEKMKGDHRCTDPLLAHGSDLLPSCAHGEIVQEDSVYAREQALMKEAMEKNFHLGMN